MAGPALVVLIMIANALSNNHQETGRGEKSLLLTSPGIYHAHLGAHTRVTGGERECEGLRFCFC